MPKLKPFYVLWTYQANFSKLKTVNAKDAIDAAEMVTGLFSKDFQEKGNVYVFDKPPALMRGPK